MSFPLRFVLRQSSAEAVFQHIALCSPTRQLTHWVLPGPAQRLLQDQPYYLLCEVPGPAALPTHEVDDGECTVLGARGEAPTESIHHGLRHGHLRLQLRGRELRGDFTLARLSSDSHIWRFSVGHPVAHPALPLRPESFG